MNSVSIGLFDSGIGGLSVLRHIRGELPHAHLIYVADSAHVPYGDKSQSYIRERSIALTAFLRDQGAGAIVIACNTATAAAAALLRSAFPMMPVIGMEPAVKPAVAATRSGIVGVLATAGTLRSAKFAALLSQYGGDVEIIVQPCPGLVEQIERGDLSGQETRSLVEQYTRPLLQQGADTLILGCTHYPFILPLIREVAGPEVTLIETGGPVARELHRRLTAGGIALDAGNPGPEQFWTSGDPDSAQRVMSLLWGQSVQVGQLPEAFR